MKQLFSKGLITTLEQLYNSMFYNSIYHFCQIGAVTRNLETETVGFTCRTEAAYVNL